MEIEQKLSQLKRSIEIAEREIQRAKQLYKELESESSKKSYKDVPGVEGTFDGFYMVTDSGEKHEVPANYSAKTKIVYGDRLKMIEENGKTVFKNINKPPRKHLDGVLNKKEGKWYVLTEKGTYRVSDNCVEFNEFRLNDRVTVLVPENNLNAPFAAIESEKRSDVEFIKSEPVTSVAKPPQAPQPRPNPAPQHTNNNNNRPPRNSASRPNSRPRPNRSDRPERKEYVSDITAAPKPQSTSMPNTVRTLDEEDLR